MRGSFVIFAFVVCGLILIGSMPSYAAVADANNVKEAIEGATVECTACHAPGNFKELNSFGTAYNGAGRSVEAVTAIAGDDSDGDGVSNADEISAGTNPGDAENN
ncbi:MAG: thrombospondin type 3 repeat-containing protein [Candidatus Omnitrophota bacterium]